MAGTKIPESVLVIVHTNDLEVLLLERADHPGFWQSVTGSRDHWQEPLAETARRELWEETGIAVERLAPLRFWTGGFLRPMRFIHIGGTVIRRA